ncbi:YodC family protein [Methylocella sp.]|uniref:YodC family protein n=1 Tax=Methylocella sp. TaxID=1978226 RepID=UPI00378319BA
MSDVNKDLAPFAPGDIVQLKSFGPAMTVVSVTDEGVNAIWYDEVDGDLKTRFVPAVALVRIELGAPDDEEDEEDDEDEWREEEARKSRGRKRKAREG